MIEKRSTKQTNKSGTDGARAKWWRGPAGFIALAGLFWLALTLFALYRQAEMSRTSSGARKAPPAQAKPTPQLSEQALRDTAWDPA